MSDQSRMKFFIRTDKGGQGRKNTGGAKLNADGVDTITNLFCTST